MFVDVRLDGGLCDKEALGDLAVVKPLGDEPEHLRLVGREVVGEGRFADVLTSGNGPG